EERCERRVEIEVVPLEHRPERRGDDHVADVSAARFRRHAAGAYAINYFACGSTSDAPARYVPTLVAIRAITSAIIASPTLHSDSPVPTTTHCWTSAALPPAHDVNVLMMPVMNPSDPTSPVRIERCLISGSAARSGLAAYRKAATNK